jgi:hypothetical protein
VIISSFDRIGGGKSEALIVRLCKTFCIALALFIAACDAQTTGSSAIPEALTHTSVTADDAENQKEVAAIRNDVYRLADVAAVASLEVELHPRGYSELRELFEANKAAVWCSGAAYALQQAYQDAGYKSWTFHYGLYDDNMLNHVATLVRVGDEIYFQDAYLNFDYPEPFFEVLEQIAKGEVPTARVQGGLRDVHVPEELVASSWAVAPGSSCSVAGTEGVTICRSEANLTLFAKRYMTSAAGVSTLDHLERLGYHRDTSSLLLFPHAVYDGKRYTEDLNHPILRRAAEIAAGRR